MNLFRKHKKFEDQLKEQLSDAEYKPSESLWDRIDSDITKDGFETGVQNSLENFEQVPYSDTWDKIAAELPEVQTGSHLFKYYGLSALTLLFAVGVWVGYEWNNQENAHTIVASAESPISVEETPGNENNNLVEAERTEPVVATSHTTNPIQPSVAVASEAKVKKQTQEITQPLLTGEPIVTTPEFTNAAPEQSIGRPSNPISQPSAQAKSTLVQTHKQALVTPPQPPAVPVVIATVPVPEKEPVLAKPETSLTTKEEQPVITSGVTQTVETTIPPVVATPPPIEVREIASNTATATDAKVIPEVARPRQDDLTKFSISILAGAHMCYMNYASPADPQFNFDQNISLRKSLERPDIDWSGAFLIDYRISPKWMISSGMVMVNFNQQFDYNTVKANNPVDPNETYGAAYKTTDSVITGNVYSNRIKYSWTEIPLFVNYNIRKGQRWDIDMQAGVGYAFLNTVDAGMVANDNKGVFALKDKDAFPQIKNAVFVSIMPQVSYRFGQNVSVGFVPTFKYSATSIIGNERWVQQHPYFVGLNICLRKRF